jgi:hypothetical protein
MPSERRKVSNQRAFEIRHLNKKRPAISGEACGFPEKPAKTVRVSRQAYA